MFWLVPFGVAFAPAMLAQLLGHHAAGVIILLDLGAVVGGLYLFMGPGSPLMVAPIRASPSNAAGRSARQAEAAWQE